MPAALPSFLNAVQMLYRQMGDDNMATMCFDITLKHDTLCANGFSAVRYYILLMAASRGTLTNATHAMAAAAS